MDSSQASQSLKPVEPAWDLCIIIAPCKTVVLPCAVSSISAWQWPRQKLMCLGYGAFLNILIQFKAISLAVFFSVKPNSSFNLSLRTLSILFLAGAPWPGLGAGTTQASSPSGCPAFWSGWGCRARATWNCPSGRLAPLPRGWMTWRLGRSC